MSENLPESARRFQNALKAAGIKAPIRQFPQSARTAKDAAAAIGCDVAQIAKSLVFRRTDTNRAVLVIASGPALSQMVRQLAGEMPAAAAADDADVIYVVSIPSVGRANLAGFRF